MKIKFLSVLSVLFMFQIISYSQFFSGFGIKGGVTLSNQKHEYKKFDYKPGLKYIVGFNGSLFAEFLRSNHFSAVIESGFEQRGYTLVYTTTNEFGVPLQDNKVFERTNYITTGLLLKIKAPSNKISPYLIIGPKLDFFLGYSVKPEDESTTLYGFDYPLDEFKKVNYSLNLGAGMEFSKLFPFKTFVELNYSPPINTSFNSEWLEVKEHYFNVKIGINFIKDRSVKIKK